MLAADDSSEDLLYMLGAIAKFEFLLDLVARQGGGGVTVGQIFFFEVLAPFPDLHRIALHQLDQIGMDQEMGRIVLAKAQQVVVSIQEAALQAKAKVMRSAENRIKDYRVRKIQTLFGTVSMRVPSLIENGRVRALLEGDRYGRSTREFTAVRDRLSSWMMMWTPLPAQRQ